MLKGDLSFFKALALKKPKVSGLSFFKLQRVYIYDIL